MLCTRDVGWWMLSAAGDETVTLRFRCSGDLTKYLPTQVHWIITSFFMVKNKLNNIDLFNLNITNMFCQAVKKNNPIEFIILLSPNKKPALLRRH